MSVVISGVDLGPGDTLSVYDGELPVAVTVDSKHKVRAGRLACN